jgi:hypothetical protein
MTVRLIEHAESYEIRYSDVSASIYVYFDEDPGRRAISGRDSKELALVKAKSIARAERERLSKPQG